MRKRLDNKIKSLPDLSFYPESHLVNEAFENPVAFGQRQKDHIAELVDIANLQLVDFEQARPKLEAALQSTDRWKRYWGLIVCSTHGEAAKPLGDMARRLAVGDEENLVRLRAAEFLALTGLMKPQDVLTQCLDTARHGVEANEVLNTLVLLRDGKTQYKFQVPPDFAKPQPGVAEMKRRLLYLNSAN